MRRELVRRTSRNSAWLLSSQVAAQSLALGFTILVARSLGAEIFGKYAFGAAVASFLTIASAFGLDLLVIRDLSREPHLVSETFSTALLTRLFLWLSGMIVLVGVSAAGGANATTIQILLLLSLAGLVTLLGNCSAAVMASRELFWPRVVSEVTGNLLRVGLAFAAVRSGFGVVAVAGAVLIASVVGAGMEIGYTVRRYRIRFVPIPRQAIGQMLKRAAPFGVAGLVFSLYFRLHLILLSMFRGDVDAGLYSAAFKAVDAWILIPGSLTAAAYPLLARSFGQDNRVFERASRLLTRVLLTVGLVVAALIAADAPGWVGLVYGDAYSGASGALAIFAFFLPLIAVNYVLGTILYAAGKAKAVVRAEVTALIVGLGCGFALIPRFGIVGAAASAVTMELAVVLCNARSVERLLGFSATKQTLYPAVPISIGLALLLAIVRFHVVWEMSAGLLLSPVLFVVLGGVSRADKDWLEKNVQTGPLRKLLHHCGLLAMGDGVGQRPVEEERRVRSA